VSQQEQPAATDRDVRRRTLALFDGRRLAVGALSLSTFVGGAVEALFLVIVTRTAFAITDGKGRVGLLLGRYVSIGTALLVALGLVLVRSAAAAWSAHQSASLTSVIATDIRTSLARAYLRATWEVQHGDRLGRLQELLTTFANRGSELVFSLTGTLTSALSLSALLLSAVLIDPLASIGVIVAVGLLANVLRPLRRSLRERAHEVSGSGMNFATSLSEVSQAALELQVFHVQGEVEHRVTHEIERHSDLTRKLLFTRGLYPAVYSALAFTAVVGALWAVSSIDGVPLNSVGAVMLVMLRSLGYGQALQMHSSAIQSSIPFLWALDDELDRLRANQVIDHGEPIGSLGPVAFESVGFSYEPGRPVLRGMTFRVNDREVVGIIGPSGGGKSTLVQLMLALRPPETGEVTAGGRAVGRLSRSEWARKVTFVPQSAHLVAGSIADNIRFFRPGVTAEQIERAGRLSNLHDDVMGWAEGYDHEVGEQGSHLSGGQQQRLVIARALVEEPDLLILDEPTSALDVQSEQLIRQTLQSLRERMSIVIIAHRLSTLDICDRIMVVQGGELKAFDTPANLSRDNDFFRDALVLSGLQPG
jgi:ABC-type multidrug transport system fused ATPase/permease subunit